MTAAASRALSVRCWEFKTERNPGEQFFSQSMHGSAEVDKHFAVIAIMTRPIRVALRTLLGRVMSAGWIEKKFNAAVFAKTSQSDAHDVGQLDGVVVVDGHVGNGSTARSETVRLLSQTIDVICASILFCAELNLAQQIAL